MDLGESGPASGALGSCLKANYFSSVDSNEDGMTERVGNKILAGISHSNFFHSLACV